MIKVRQFLPKDFKKISEIAKESFLHPWTDSYLRKVSQEHTNDILVAETAGKTVGYILGYIKPDKSGSIKILAVDPNYREQGVGGKLIETIVGKLKKEGANEVFLKLRADNSVAYDFYGKLGFIKTKRIRKYFSNGDDAYIMRKKLMDG